MAERAKARYDVLKIRREPFLRRARLYAELTIPGLLPPEGHNYSLDLPQPYQGLGARCVVNLSSRLMTALLPPGQNSFRFAIPAEVIAKSGNNSTPPDIEKNLALAEKQVHGEIERKGWRQPTNTSLQLTMVTGNALEHMLPDNTIRVFRLDQYVVVRDPSGKVVELIVEENMYPASMPPELRELAKVKDDQTSVVPLYTWVRWNPKKSLYEAHQEIGDTIVPGSQGTWSILPFFPLRWTAIAGEDYGRGKVEEHAPDLISVEGLSKSLLEGAALASRHVQMIRPNASGGLNLRNRLSKAKNGDWVVGNPEDVNFMKFDNYPQLQFVSQELQALKTDLAAAFLLNSGTRRDAERVTAQELRMMAEELEGTLGGVYSTLNQEMAAPRLNRLILQMQKTGGLPEWPQGMIEPTVLTGLEALGREQDVQRVVTALQFLQGIPEEGQDYVKWPTLLNKGLLGLGLPDSVKSEAEVQQLRQQRAATQAVTASAPQMVKGAIEQGAVG